MELTNAFVVPVPIGESWRLLMDVERIAGCLPGATIRQIGENTFEGAMTVKIGPIKVQFTGVGSFVEVDQDQGSLVLVANGKERGGRGSAEGRVRLHLSELSADKTKVDVVSEIQIAGKIAQVGQNALADVSARLIAQFATNLETLLASESTVDEVAAEPPELASPAKPVTRVSPAVTELNLLSLLTPRFKQWAPGAALLIVGIALGRFLRHRCAVGLDESGT